MANINHPLFIAELSSVSELSSVEKAKQSCDFLCTMIDKHAPPSMRKVRNHNSSMLLINKRLRKTPNRETMDELTIFKNLY